MQRGCGRKVGRWGVRIGVRMFSMEDRRRAVDLYFTEGMTIRKVIAELGYPSEGALVKWVREDPRYTGACRRSYTLECKTNAARRALEGEPLARVARDAGCTPTSVYQWMRRYRSEGILGLMDRRNAPMPAEPMPAAGDDVEELRRQVEVLRLENAVMRETIDVLKADDPRLPQPLWFKDYAVDVEQADPDSMYTLYHAALAIRQESLTATRDTTAEQVDMGADVVAYRRAAVEGRTFTSVTNFGTAPVSLPEGSVVLTSGPLTPDGQLPTDTSAWVIK